MALSVSYRLGTPIQVPDIDWSSERCLGSRDPGDLWFCGVRSGRVEGADRSCAYGDNGTAEGIDIAVIGATEGTDLNAPGIVDDGRRVIDLSVVHFRKPAGKIDAVPSGEILNESDARPLYRFGA